MLKAAPCRRVLGHCSTLGPGLPGWSSLGPVLSVVDPRSPQAPRRGWRVLLQAPSHICFLSQSVIPHSQPSCSLPHHPSKVPTTPMNSPFQRLHLSILSSCSHSPNTSPFHLLFNCNPSLLTVSLNVAQPSSLPNSRTCSPS